VCLLGPGRTSRAYADRSRRGDRRSAAADEDIHRYYGPDFFAVARADTLTDAEEIQAELRRLEDAGCDDVVLYPCSGDLEQVVLLADAVHDRLMPPVARRRP